MLPFLLFPTFLLFASHGDLLGVVCQHSKWNVRYWFNTKLVYFDTCYKQRNASYRVQTSNRFKTQDCRVIGVESNAFWSDFSFPILTSNKKREAGTIEAFILGLIRNLLLSKVSFYSTLVTLKKLSKVGNLVPRAFPSKNGWGRPHPFFEGRGCKVGVQTEWQRIKTSLWSRPEPKKVGLLWQTTESTKFKYAPQETWNLIWRHKRYRAWKWWKPAIKYI